MNAQETVQLLSERMPEIRQRFGDNPGGSMLGGKLTVAADDGVANFSNLTLNNPDNGYTLTIFAGSLTPATTIAFNVDSPANS